MPKYRKLPVEVEAIEWTGNNEAELIEFTRDYFRAVPADEQRAIPRAPGITAEVYDALHATWVGVKTGQHVVRGVKGEFYPIDPAVLAETYEPAEAADGARYDRDPEAIAWARRKVERSVDMAEQGSREARLDDEQRERWRFAAWFMRREFLGSGEGCVITAFDERLPEWTRRIEAAQQPGGDAR
ncbi:hypothetical protein [Streptomyces sp. NPDC096153]|uniref:hypothetical protein n=1 Tax=Streptomyces sp. NPDC096153 TaxID=3155548 RepID=UPI00332A3D3A